DVDVPVVLTLHSDVLSWRRWTLGATRIPTEWAAYAALVHRALNAATSIVAVSRFLAQEVGHLYGSVRDIRVIYNGWPAAATGPQHERVRATLVAGRAWDAAKNISLAAAAAYGATPVYVAGPQEHPESGARLELPPPLQALGFLARAELDAMLRSSLIYLSPARYDPFGLLPLQAALNGCALLLSDIPSYRELWEGVATFFRSDDPIDLRRQWTRLLDEPSLALELAGCARRRALERYTPARMAAAYLDLYGALSAASRTVTA
ncbi:MAG: glycosyltransferase family 4 protein, partial [Chloroflexi bacterium]|nr:glycosyltransferase family 4 protein [Chloroflexota bacterium]